MEKTISKTEMDDEKKYDHSFGLWLLQAAFELEESSLCLDLCQREIAQSQGNVQYQLIFLSSLARLLVRNEVVKEFHVKTHFDQIGDQDLRLLRVIKENAQKEEIIKKDLLDRIIICDAIISGELSDYKKILERELDQEFASTKIKAEYLINIDAKTNEALIVTKKQAVEHVWSKLKAERRSGNQLAIRY